MQLVDRSAIGRKSKMRGNSFESEIAKKFSAWSGKEFNRTPASGSLHWGDNNQFKVDGDVITSDPQWPYLIECKRYDSVKLGLEELMNGNEPFPKFVAQSVREGLHTKCPWMLVFRRNRIHGFVLFPYTDKLPLFFSDYMVKTIHYTSELTGLEESIKTFTIPLDELLDAKYSTVCNIYDSPTGWKSWIKEIEKPVTKEPDIDSLMKGIDDLGL